MDHLTRALTPVLADLGTTGALLPVIEPSSWQDWPHAESAILRAADGSGMGIWTDASLGTAQQVAMVAEQVQDWAVEELPRQHLPSNWPRCEEHPVNHPLQPVVAGDRAVWACPMSGRSAGEIGRLSGPTQR